MTEDKCKAVRAHDRDHRAMAPSPRNGAPRKKDRSEATVACSRHPRSQAMRVTKFKTWTLENGQSGIGNIWLRELGDAH